MSQMPLPPPPVPPEVDLAGYGFMPLYGHRLFGSDFNACCSDAQWRAGVTLWWASWNQVPAASLPDDDVALARLADLGRDVKTWRKLRENALRGFVKCSDGRLYHPVLAKYALEAWDRRMSDRERKKKWRERINLSSDGPRDGDGDGDTSRDGDGDRSGTSALRGRGTGRGTGIGTGRTSNGAAAGSDGSNAPDPAATAAARKLLGVDREAVSEAVERGDLAAVLAAFRCNLSEDRLGEWQRDTDGMQLGMVVVVLAWRRSQGDHAREPSGFRRAVKEWRQLGAEDRAAIVGDLAPAYGLPAPAAAVRVPDGVEASP